MTDLKNDLLRKYLLASALRMAEDGGSPTGIIELESTLADAEKPPELRAGKYVAELQGVEVRTSNAGNEYFNVKFIIAPEELGADQQDIYPDGATMFYNRLLVPKDQRSMYNLKRWYETLGLSTKITSVDVNEWMGCRARLIVEQKPFEGEMRAQIRAVEQVEGETAPARKPASRGRQEEEEEAPASRGRGQRQASGGRRR